jgi:hypothetical protein
MLFAGINQQGCRRLRNLNTILWPVLSIRAAVFMVSPNNWKRTFSARKTPAVTGPLCNPNRMARSVVPGPSSTLSFCVNSFIFCKHSYANLVTIMDPAIINTNVAVAHSPNLEDSESLGNDIKCRYYSFGQVKDLTWFFDHSTSRKAGNVGKHGGLVGKEVGNGF